MTALHHSEAAVIGGALVTPDPVVRARRRQWLAAQPRAAWRRPGHAALARALGEHDEVGPLMAAMLEDEVADALAVIDRCIDTGIAELPHLRRHAEVVIASLQLERAQVRAATEEQAPS